MFAHRDSLCRKIARAPRWCAQLSRPLLPLRIRRLEEHGRRDESPLQEIAQPFSRSLLALRVLWRGPPHSLVQLKPVQVETGHKQIAVRLRLRERPAIRIDRQPRSRSPAPTTPRPSIPTNSAPQISARTAVFNPPRASPMSLRACSGINSHSLGQTNTGSRPYRLIGRRSPDAEHCPAWSASPGGDRREYRAPSARP